jgi:PAS domain S-box-containing protein
LGVSLSDDEELIEAVGVSPTAMVLTNPRRADNPLEVVNARFTALTGYSEQDAVGRNCRFLAGGGTEESTTERIRRAVGARRSVLVDILNYRADGTPFRNGVMVSPIFGDDGELTWFLGSQVDLGEERLDPLAERRESAARRVADLPKRQREVLGCVARGLLNKQTAWELKISEKTVKMHRALLLERLGVETSAEAIRIAVEAGL